MINYCTFGFIYIIYTYWTRERSFAVKIDWYLQITSAAEGISDLGLVGFEFVGDVFGDRSTRVLMITRRGDAPFMQLYLSFRDSFALLT